MDDRFKQTDDASWGGSSCRFVRRNEALPLGGTNGGGAWMVGAHARSDSAGMLVTDRESGDIASRGILWPLYFNSGCNERYCYGSDAAEGLCAAAPGAITEATPFEPATTAMLSARFATWEPMQDAYNPVCAGVKGASYGSYNGWAPIRSSPSGAPVPAWTEYEKGIRRIG